MDAKTQIIQKSEDELKRISKYKELLIGLDPRKFGKFLRKNRRHYTGIPESIFNSTDSEMLDFMHYLRASYPYLGKHFKDSRNYFRASELQKAVDEKRIESPALSNYLEKTDGIPPTCKECQYFRKGPNGERNCIMLRQADRRGGALPDDIACAGWTPITP